MRRVLLAAVLGALLVSGFGAPPVGAITSYNSVPAPERTEVGTVLVLFDSRDEDPDFDEFIWVCSGTMADEDTFLTAAHCITGWPEGATFYVSLEEDVQAFLDEAVALGLTGEAARNWALAEGLVVAGTPFHDPAFPGTGADAHDIGVLEVEAAAVADLWTFTPAVLPGPDQLGALGRRQLDALDWWVAGYGTEEAERGPGGHTHPGGGVRRKALVDFNALNKAWVRLSMVASRGYGGACYGDSGGPNFVVLPDGTWLLAAITITGDTPCYATNVAYRLDTPSARAFLDDFVVLPDSA